MDSKDAPEPDDDFVESVLIRYGLIGFVIGLGAVYGVMYALWRYGLTYFSGA